MTITPTAPLRDTDLARLVDALNTQQAAKWDAVVPASAIHATDDATLSIADTGPAELTLDGVTTTPGEWSMTAAAVGHLAGRLDVPAAYARRCWQTHPSLWAENMNGWLHYDNDAEATRYLLRGFRLGDDTGLIRAVLSDRFGGFDHLDALTACLDGVRQVDADVIITGCDLTDSTMRVRLACPTITAESTTLLRGYRSPFGPDSGLTVDRRWGGTPVGQPGATNGTVFAGLVLTNSETGDGAYTVQPRIVVQVCSNGLTVNRDLLRKVHVGARLEPGVVRWSEQTTRAAVDLVRSKTADVVRTVLSPEWLTETVADLDAKAAGEVRPGDVEPLLQTLGYSEAERADVLAHFMVGGQPTRGGVVNAITSWAQTVEDADRSARAEQDALLALTA